MNDKETEKRINFKSGVADILYRQAGGRCSVPRCQNPTMGPYYAADDAVNMGVASHIYSAAEKGPRGWGGKDAAFISSEENGIWCCQYHSVLIDKNKGIDYPASQLFAWKNLAEARVRKQMNDSPSPLGWIDSIEFTKFVRHLKLPRIDLSRCTLLWGNNESGKSSLMQMAASVSDAHHAERFMADSVTDSTGELNPAHFCGRMTYSTVDTLSKDIQLEISDRALVRKEGTTHCLLPPGDVEVIYCFEDSRKRLDDEDDLDFLMRVLNLDKSALLALTKLSNGVLMPGEFKFTQADEDYSDEADEGMCKRVKTNNQPYIELSFKKHSREFFISYAGLSGSEKSRLLLDLFISKAREVAKQRLTLMMIEDLADGFDDNNYAILLTALAKEPFQSLLTLPRGQEKSCLVFENGLPQLQKLDHLSAWKLATLPPPIKSR